MAEFYLSSDGDLIDEVCWRHYPLGQQALALETVYEANRGLARLGARLNAGVSIFLPDLPRPKTTPIVRIWG